ncbi:hypothetical protein [Chitinophaga arvensicola]|uniref:Uncharacterized protein n=1 Tax=Chitinophaga arvensicola TaxID=29529 RepID=A0A1I0S8R8_9BACT|nr:hypothetical protein [Chitinophaga arvensicola]SEW52507.1 hypothetical protein SAMN04488122_4886 [Chitinophaga arvensicola]
MKHIVKPENGYYLESDKHLIIKAYLSSNRTKQSIWEEYTGHVEENGKILKWMRELGYEAPGQIRKLINQRSSLMVKESIQSRNNDFEKEAIRKTYC